MIFFDTTFKVLPTHYKPYNPLITSGLAKNVNKTIPMIFILLKYLDVELYERLFTFLNINFNFRPNIVHSLFELALNKAISI